jgi:uncharacterized protein
MPRQPLIVDGYNVLHENSQLAGFARRSLEDGREALVNYLSAKASVYDITVVYDGWRDGQAIESVAMARGVRVIYSRMGERADEVIKRLAAASGGTAIVVSRDGEICDYARLAGCVVASPDSLTTPDRPARGPAPERHQKKGPARRSPRQRGPAPWRF